MSLPDALSRLAELIPERVLWVNHTEEVAAVVACEYHRLVWAGADEWLIEGALREECQARGWTYNHYAQPPSHTVELFRDAWAPSIFGAADTPAQALALALIAALEGE